MERLPQEIEVWYIIPELRKELATALNKKGMKQGDIAKVLGITGAAVSQYISKKRGGKIELCKEIKNEIKKSANELFKTKKSANPEIQKILAKMKTDQHICECHKKIDKTVDCDCSVCYGDKE